MWFRVGNGYAFGTTYVDDGETVPPTPNTTLTITAHKGAVSSHPSGTYHLSQRLSSLTVLGAGERKPNRLGQRERSEWLEVRRGFGAANPKLTISDLKVDLNHPVVITWS